MTQMLDDRFDDLLRDSAREYNEPPETPREAIWAAIQAERAVRAEGAGGKEADAFRRFRHFRSVRYVRPLIGVAALLALGIGLGRLSVDRPAGSPAESGPAMNASRLNATAYQVATMEHLGQSEAFLTLFRASLKRGGEQPLASPTARQLLATNRLLLDSPAASDAKMRLLLQDLELVLAEIAQLSPRPRARDLDLITDGLEQGGVLSRLRTAVPSGPSTTQGAL
jgi:hypothetical protein